MRFNSGSSGTRTKNLAGGTAYKVDNKFELASLLLTSFVKDSFYESAKDNLNRLVGLIQATDPEFVAKAALYARRRAGMRSITHAVAGELLTTAKGRTWLRPFLDRLFKRPDDMLEIVSYHAAKHGFHPMPNALKRAIRGRLSKLNEYSLAKYRGEGKKVKMVDLVNLTHPKDTPAIKKLMKGELKATETWETKLTQAGQKAESEEEKLSLKTDAWKELLTENKLGYLALLRNARNILQQAPECKALLCAKLMTNEAVRQSLVFPFQIAKAVEAVGSVPASNEVAQALSTAAEISLANVPKFPGRTLVAVDISGSMRGDPIKHGALFAAALYKSNDADLMVFNTGADTLNSRYKLDSLFSIAMKLETMISGGTNFAAIFTWLKTHRQVYDRIVILSDMQSWAHDRAMPGYLAEYEKRTGVKPHVYSFDLQGYGTVQFPQNRVYCLAGFSDKVFNVMQLLEQDPKALVHEIEKESLMGVEE